MIYTVTLNPALDYFMDFDQAKLGQVNRATETRMLPGGKGIVESRMMSLLKVENTALGFLGGFPGKFIQDYLENIGSQSDFTPIAGTTRINTKIKVNAQEETSFDAAGPDLSDAEIQAFLSKFDDLQSDDIVVFAGTIPKALGEDFYEVLIEKVKARGAQFAIDVDGQKLLKTLKYEPLVIKPNREELEEIYSVKFKSKEDIIPYGQKLLAEGAQNVMISMAGDGALLFTGKETYFAAPIKGELKNSIGAGDSTVAGFLAEWSRSQDTLAAFKQGVACGTAKVFSEDMASESFLKECFEKVTIEKINED